MLLAIVDHVAALAQALQISWLVIALIVTEMGRGQDQPDVTDLRGFDEVRPTRRPCGFEPTAIGGFKFARKGSIARSHASSEGKHIRSFAHSWSCNDNVIDDIAVCH